MMNEERMRQEEVEEERQREKKERRFIGDDLRSKTNKVDQENIQPKHDVEPESQ